MTLSRSLLMFVLPHELMVLLMHKLTNKLDLISIACELFESKSGKSHRIFGTFQ